jgi:two-component system, OmpR family, response regulator
MSHIVIADDDKAVRQMLTDYLAGQNIPARSASNRAELNRQLKDMQPSMILLDLELGQEDGLDLLREIRSRSDVPIILMTGHRSDEIDRVVGLELGAATLSSHSA